MDKYERGYNKSRFGKWKYIYFFIVIKKDFVLLGILVFFLSVIIVVFLYVYST